MNEYDPSEDARKSYDAAIEAKRLRGDTHDWEGHKSNRRSQMDKQYTASGMTNGHAATQIPSCFSRLEESVAQLRNIRNRVSALADMLAGTIPESTMAGAEIKGSGDGRFDQIDRASGDINELCDQITGSLSRIERRL